MSKAFHSINAVKKQFFPVSYQKEMEEQAIKKFGIGAWLARRFLAQVKVKLVEVREGKNEEI